MKIRSTAASVLVFALAVMLFACSSGGGDNGAAPNPPPISGGTGTAVIAKGVMTKGSVIVNGVRFDDTAAAISADDSAKTAAFLQDGMVVKVKGTRNDDGVTGTADVVEVENEVRGTVESVGTGTFSVLGQTVIVSSATITSGGWTYDPATGAITGLVAASSFVEVHGDRNAAGDILASRVELFGAVGADELRGIVSGLTGTFSPGDSFSIDGFAIATTLSTTVIPAAPVVNGTLVEVHLTSGTATRIEPEDAEDVEFEPAEGEQVEVEGLVGNYDSVSDFDINGQHVHLTSSTVYEGGIYADIVNDVKVEAEGHMSAGILVADKVKFKDSIRFEANADATGLAGVLDKTIYVTAGTEFVNLANAGDITIGDGLRIRGYLNSDGVTITATRVEKRSNPIDASKIILQGPASAKDEVAKTLTIIGITVDLSAVPANEIKDSTGTIITLTQFYASITLNSTAVKVRGSYSAGTLTADKAELD